LLVDQNSAWPKPGVNAPERNIGISAQPLGPCQRLRLAPHLVGLALFWQRPVLVRYLVCLINTHSSGQAARPPGLHGNFSAVWSVFGFATVRV
jgi:hypothetical protein